MASLLFMSGVSAPAAAEWTSFGKNKGGDEFFIDLATVKKGARARAWLMTNYDTPLAGRAWSSKVYYEVDCDQERVRDLAARYYGTAMAEGKLLESSDSPSEWKYADPQSFRESLVYFLCNKLR